MQAWKERLRAATDALCRAVGELHAHGHAAGSGDPAARLVHAVTDVLQLQELVNRSLEDALRTERAWRAHAEERIRALEVAVDAAGSAAESSQELTSRAPTPRKRALPCVQPHVGQSVEKVESWNAGAEERTGFRIDDVGLKAVQDQHEVGWEALAVETPSKRARVEKTNVGPQARRSLPPLPTLKEVERDLAKRRKEKRARENYKPPPCDRCRLRKRALMLREFRDVDEEKFERWARKPGACLEYMHLDEEVPDDQPRSQLTFDESETQSPR